MSRYDPDIFYKFREVLIRKACLDDVPEMLKADIARDAAIVASNYYPLNKSRDVYFGIGRLHMAIKRYEAAIKYFTASLELDWHYKSQHNIGICYFHLGAYDGAREAFVNVLDTKPWFSSARTWLARVETIIASR